MIPVYAERGEAQTSRHAQAGKPSAIAAALHVGLPLLHEHLWEGGIPAFLVVPPQPGTDVPYPAWVGRMLALGEAARNEARSALAGAFDADAAETLVKALWCRAFGNHLGQAGIPDWRTYGRMLLADPELAAFGLPRNDLVGVARTRSGVESLCDGGPLPGVRPGYTHVFEGDLKILLDGGEAPPRLHRGRPTIAGKARRRR